MNSYLQLYIEDKNTIDPSCDNLVERIVTTKSLLNKSKKKYDDFTIEEFDKQKKILKDRCDFLESKLEKLLKEFKSIEVYPSHSNELHKSKSKRRLYKSAQFDSFPPIIIN